MNAPALAACLLMLAGCAPDPYKGLEGKSVCINGKCGCVIEVNRSGLTIEKKYSNGTETRVFMPREELRGYSEEGPCKAD